MGLLSTFFTWWTGPTLGTQVHTRRHGTEVGRDGQGNIYYRSKAAPDRRWVIYNGEPEATRVPPEWHLWLHHTIDTTPVEQPLLTRTWEKPWSQNATGTAVAKTPSGALTAGGHRAKASSDYQAWTPE